MGEKKAEQEREREEKRRKREREGEREQTKKAGGEKVLKRMEGVLKAAVIRP